MSSSKLARTRSEQLVDTLSSAFRSPILSEVNSGPSDTGGGGSSNQSRKSGRRMISASPGRGSGSRNTHIRKSRSAQINKIDLEELSSGAALSRASSASLGLSFSFTGFTVPSDEIADTRPFSDEDILEDIEAGKKTNRFQAEPTFPILLKAHEAEF